MLRLEEGREVIFPNACTTNINICLDFNSLYPSIIQSMSVSPENAIVSIEGDDSKSLLGDALIDWTLVNGEKGEFLSKCKLISNSEFSNERK